MESDRAGRVRTACHGEPAPARSFDRVVNRRSFFLELVLGALLFCVLTVSVFTYQFSRMNQGGAAFSWQRLHFGYLWLLLLCLPLDSIVSALRIWVVCRILRPGTRLGTCLKAEWANVGVAMLTPSQTGGGIGQIYMLSRSGIDISSAMIISLITFLGTMIGLLCVGLYSALIGGVRLSSCSSMAVWPLTIILGSMTVPLLCPGLFRAAVLQALRGVSAVYGLGHRVLRRPLDSGHGLRSTALARDRALSEGKPSRGRPERSPAESKGDDAGAQGFALGDPPLNGPDVLLPGLQRLGARLIDLVFHYHHDTRKFIREGRLHFVAVCLLSLEFIMARCFMAFLCIRFLGIESSSPGEVVKIQMALQFLLYFAPTPGSSGVAELLSFSSMSAIIPPGLGAHYTLLWRTSTLYLPAALGLISLSLAALSDTGRFLGRKALSSDEVPSGEGLDSENSRIPGRGTQGRVEGASSRVRWRPTGNTGLLADPRFTCGDPRHHEGTQGSNPERRK